jgi:hypothetical protein
MFFCWSAAAFSHEQPKPLPGAALPPGATAEWQEAETDSTKPLHQQTNVHRCCQPTCCA